MSTELEKLVRENRAPKELAEAVKTGEKKSRAVSVRMEEPLFKAIEAQAELWNEKPAETMRKFLRFYFLPVELETELRSRGEKFWKGEFAPEDAGEYMTFLLEALKKIRSSALFLKGEALKLNETLEDRINEVLEEDREDVTKLVVKPAEILSSKVKTERS